MRDEDCSWGICEHPEMGGNTLFGNAWGNDEYDTYPNFGCVLFEEK